MTEIQAKILGIYREFDRICRKHDIEYFLTGGSALGAIRHRGFIPWDDDIDVGMTRQMWNTLRPFLEKELPDGMVLVDHRNHPTYRNPIAKIVDTGTTVLYRSSLADECPKGQYIEVFVHDPVPAARLAEHKRNFLTYCELMTPYFSVFSEKMNYKKGLRDDELDTINDYYAAKKRAEAEGLDTVLDQLEKEIGKYDYKDSDYLLLDWGVNTCYYPIDNFDGIRYERFEDMEAPVAARACDNLRIDYGNSWTDYPPAALQMAHVTVGDENIDGDEYMKIICRQIDLEETRRMRLSQKDVLIRELPERVAYNKMLLGIQMDYAKLKDSKANDLRSLYSSGEYAAIAERFKDYTGLKRKLRNYDLGKDITPETREILAKSLVMLDRTAQAEDVLDMPRNMLLSDASSETERDIIRITRARSFYYDKLYDQAEKMLAETGEDLKRSPAYRKTAARLDLVKGKKSQDIFKMAEEYPDDTEALKIKADYLYADGKKTEAEELYDKVLKGTRNGMDILDIQQKRA